MYQALYRKYRPKTFDDVVGQNVIVKTLKNSIKNEIVTHAYLFSGPRGTGKTSIAKIFAKILNCHNLNDLEPCEKCVSCEQANNNQNIDIIEIDAASNNGVDEIREIRNKVTLVPTNSKYKIYIIDEVHMLTNQAFNALLKTLEEPPAHIIFIFATTEPHKIPKTILSRCQRFDYKKVNIDDIVHRLNFICNKENINITEEALREIAKLSDGGMRDSISLLDQSLAYSDDEITVKDIHEINGTLDKEEVNELIFKILNNEIVDVLNLIERYDKEGRNFYKIINELIDELKNCLIYINAPKMVEEDDFYKKIKDMNSSRIIYTLIKNLSSLLDDLKNTNNSKLLFEIEIIKVMNNDFVGEMINTPLLNIENKPINNPIIAQNSVHNESTTIVENNIAETTLSSKKVEGAKVDKTIEKQKKINSNKVNIEELKKIRINNSLCKFSQKERERVKNKLEELNDFLTDSKYGKIVSLINDGELKAVSENYLMFMYKTELMATSFNQDIDLIEELFEKCFYETYRVIAIDLNDWDFIKVDYNKNKDKYKFIEEKINIKTENDEEIVESSNEIDEMFNDIIEYE